MDTDISDSVKLLEIICQKDLIIEQRNLELHNFAYLAAHDLREPLRNMGLVASLIEQQLKEKSYNDIDHLLTILQRAASYGSSLVKSLLDYSEANQKPNLVNIDLSELIPYAIHTLEDLIHEQGCDIEYSRLPHVWGCKRQLVLVVDNLIKNAIKHNYQKKIKISICAEGLGDKWLLSFRDDGVGIPKKLHHEVFLPFKRLHQAQNPRNVGLGLTICRRIIEQHGGEMWLDPDISQGTGVMLTLNSV